MISCRLSIVPRAILSVCWPYLSVRLMSATGTPVGQHCRSQPPQINRCRGTLLTGNLLTDPKAATTYFLSYRLQYKCSDSNIVQMWAYVAMSWNYANNYHSQSFIIFSVHFLNFIYPILPQYYLYILTNLFRIITAWFWQL